MIVIINITHKLREKKYSKRMKRVTEDDTLIHS